MFLHSKDPTRQGRDGDSDDGSDQTDSDCIIPHTWLGHKNLLRLLDPSFSGNYEVFLKVWKNEYPLIISHISKNLDMKLWTPETFSQRYGESKVDIINCITGEVIPNQKMQIFWDGFEDVGSRPKDKKGCPLLLKMKEWPRCTMFESILPLHMGDLLQALPLTAYTHPNGLLNFVNYIPNGFLTKDLGTELLCAYGTAKYPWVGTKNLHVNKTDALNILVYVGKDTNEDNVYEETKVLQAVEDAGCDEMSIERVIKNGDIPGAVWHVYNSQDTKKINDLLKKVNFSRGIISQPNQDLINDENWYLDRILRGRLRREYKIEVHAVLQCLGDAVIIPAGAPHQVRFLKSCIMVKHDFISSQNMKKL
ncbi:Uncharacterized protein GBIM_17875 [Gryllus bimaculatus]|nr:Uncharacterized protein GBIM_17875 [Gryllus bimaculatus]